MLNLGLKYSNGAVNLVDGVAVGLFEGVAIGLLERDGLADGLREQVDVGARQAFLFITE